MAFVFTSAGAENRLTASCVLGPNPTIFLTPKISFLLSTSCKI